MCVEHGCARPEWVKWGHIWGCSLEQPAISPQDEFALFYSSIYSNRAQNLYFCAEHVINFEKQIRPSFSDISNEVNLKGYVSGLLHQWQIFREREVISIQIPNGIPRFLTPPLYHLVPSSPQSYLLVREEWLRGMGGKSQEWKNSAILPQTHSLCAVSINEKDAGWHRLSSYFSESSNSWSIISLSGWCQATATL